MPPEPLLALRDVWVAYGKVQALKGVSLDLFEGEITALIGANGAGKTTTLKTISGLHHPFRGSIVLAGRRIDGLPPHQIVSLGVCQAPEGRGTFPGMSVAENLAMGAYARRDRSGIGRDYDRVYNLFPILADRRSQPAGTLSGGEQQMLAIGRALMARPTTILLVEQNAQAALRRAHRGYVLETGRVVMEAAASDLLGDVAVQRAYLGGDIAAGD